MILSASCGTFHKAEIRPSLGMIPCNLTMIPVRSVRPPLDSPNFIKLSRANPSFCTFVLPVPCLERLENHLAVAWNFFSCPQDLCGAGKTDIPNRGDYGKNMNILG